MRLQRLDVGLDLDAGAELGRDRVFQSVRHVVGGAQRKLAVHLQVERNRQPVLQVVHRHMMHGERAIARDHHDAIEHGLVVERDRIGGDDRLGARHLLAERGRDRVLDRAHAIERQCAADRHRQIDESLARRPRARAPARRGPRPAHARQWR